MRRMASTIVCLCLFAMASTAMAVPTTLIDQGDVWQYSQFRSPDLWVSWGTAGYGSFDWDAATWETGSAAFGNPYSLPYNTLWDANTDLALQKTLYIDGALTGDLTLNVASDNGFMVFINGTQVAKENAEGYTSYWEYTFGVGTAPFLAPGSNVIRVLAEDHGGATFFDMKLTGDVNPVPEPGTMVLLGSGLLGLTGAARRKRAKRS